MERKLGDLVFREESFEIVGAAFFVFNELGYGLREDYYQKALAREFDGRAIQYEREKIIQVPYKGNSLGNLRIDFLVGGKIAVELKVRHALGYPHIKQVTNYLKAANVKLAIILYFTRDGVKFRRVLNPGIE